MILQTAKCPLVALRGAVTADDTFLTVFKYTDWPSSNTLNLADANNKLHDANQLGIMVHGSNAANENANYELYGRLRATGPILLLAAGAVTLGTQVCALDPIDNTTVITNGLWADTITVTSGILMDFIDILASGENGICIMRFDKWFIQDIAMYFTISDAGSASTSMYAKITGY